MNRRITYITGTRADYGLMRRTLAAIHADEALSLDLIATGMHLDPRYGDTAAEVRRSGFAIRGEVPVQMTPETGATMARNIGRMTEAFCALLERDSPDAVLLLGDRGEMLAGAIAATHLNIPVVHIHGGERSGTIDESVRHAISKLSHVHCVATEASRERLIHMGEDAARVHVTGAPGLDGLSERKRSGREDLARAHSLDPEKLIAILIHHPVTQDEEAGAKEIAAILAALRRAQMQVLALMPNSDAGGQAIRDVLIATANEGGVAVTAHLPRDDFLSAFVAFDLLVGNSSSGIIETASFGLPVINVGSRQNLRERNGNVTDIAASDVELDQAIADALAHGRFAPANIYGDGHAGRRIVTVLRDMPSNCTLLFKANSY